MSLWFRSMVVLLLTGLMAQVSCVQLYRVLFAMNRKAIAERLCERRTKHCNGRCFLKKKIASAVESREAPAEKAPSPKSSPESLELMPALEPDVQPLEIQLEIHTLPSLCCGPALPEGHTLPIDHPPDHIADIIAA